MQLPSPPSSGIPGFGKLCLVAGSGDLPFQIVDALKQRTQPFCLVAVADNASPELVAQCDGVPVFWLQLGQLSPLMGFLKDQGVTHLVMIGGIQRPAWSSLKLDLQAMKVLGSLALRPKGDDAVLRALVAFLEGQGIAVVGVEQFLPRVMESPAGMSTRRQPTDDELVDIRHGWALLDTLSALDIGQGVVVQQGLVLAVEAIEGTDAMLQRAATLKRPGPGAPILVKRPKRQQDRRVDAPTLGVATVRNAHAAGLAGIVFEHNGTLFAEGYPALVAEADALGLFVVGYHDAP